MTVSLDVQTAALLTGIAVLLDDDDVATYRPDESQYAAGEVPIVFAELPPSGPGIAVGCYGVDQVDESSLRYAIQVRIRTSGDPLDLDLVDGVWRSLSGRRRPPMPDGLDVVLISGRSRGYLGRSGGLHLYSQNFSALT